MSRKTYSLGKKKTPPRAKHWLAADSTSAVIDQTIKSKAKGTAHCHTRRRRAATPRSGGQGMQSSSYARPPCRW